MNVYIDLFLQIMIGVLGSIVLVHGIGMLCIPKAELNKSRNFLDYRSLYDTLINNYYQRYGISLLSISLGIVILAGIYKLSSL